MQPDEDLDGLDSASVLKQQDLTTTKIVRGDSGDSNHSSIGDIPIELPHLEEEEDMYHIPLFFYSLDNSLDIRTNCQACEISSLFCR